MKHSIVPLFCPRVLAPSSGACLLMMLLMMRMTTLMMTLSTPKFQSWIPSPQQSLTSNIVFACLRKDRFLQGTDSNNDYD